MKKTRYFALLLSIAMILALLTACSGAAETSYIGPDGRTAKAEQEYRTLYAEEVSTMNYLVSGSTNDLVIGANTVDSLVENDSYGNILPAAAQSWEVSADGLTWTFHLRPGQYWYDAAGDKKDAVTAHDFVAAIRYVCDARNKADNFYMVDGWITGASEYQAYTAAVRKGFTNDASEYLDSDPAENPAATVVPAYKAEDIGVVAVDDTTLQFHLVIPRPYFLTALQFGTYWPAPASLLESLGTGFGVDSASMWYNGAYILSEFAPQNSRVLSRNPGYWDKDNVHITKITQTYNADASTLAPELYMSGETDYADIPADILPAWQADPEKAANLSPIRVTRDYNYFYCFNFEPRFDAAYEPENWGKAVNNENFRQVIFHALDRVSAMEVTYPGRSADLLQYSITPNAFAISENTGKDYTSYGDLAALWEQNPFEEASAKDFRDKARTELEAAGATFPIKVLFPYNASVEMWGKENAAIEQQLENLLGADFIDIIVEAADSEGFLENVRRAGKYALLKCNWGADYADPETWTSPFAPDNTFNFAYDTTGTLGINTKTNETMALIGEYTSLVETAKTQYSDTDARYNAFAKAEAFYINKAMVIPYGITGGDYQATRLSTFEGEYASFGYAINRYKYRWVYETGQSEEMFTASQTQWEEHFS